MNTTLPSPLGSILDVTATRMKLLVTHGARYTDKPEVFDITDTRSLEVQQRLVELLSDHARLAYQFCALSEAPWQILWSPGRQGYLPFFDRPFTLIAFCDPVGPEEDREALLSQFFTLARGKGKHAIIVAATDNVRKAAMALGFSGLWIGTEPLVDLAGYSLTGKTGRKLRQEANHMRHLGGAAREIFPIQNDADRQAMEEVVLEWKNHLRQRYNTSFLGTKPMENAHLRRYFAVEIPGDPPGSAVMQSFLICSPVSRRGWYLDLVRRPGAPRGATELAILSAIDIFRAEGTEFVTIGLIPFYDPTGQHIPSKTDLLIQWGIRYWDRLYHFSGMQTFRSKFSPTHTESAHILYWPPILTPQVVWDVTSALTTDVKKKSVKR